MTLTAQGSETQGSETQGPAPRSLAPEPGGELLAEIRHARKRLVFRDSASWGGTGAISLVFPAIPEGAGYQAVVQYCDPNGLITHADTVPDLEVLRARTTQASFRLRALLGRLQLVVPSAPASVDTLGLSWESGGLLRQTKVVRGPSGRTLLRLDSLPVGSSGTVRVRAWGLGGDTAFVADTVCSILSQSDQIAQIRLIDTRGQVSMSATFLAGGENDALALFPDDKPATGRLVLAALSDSGTSDWIRLDNRSDDSLVGAVRIVRGSEALTVELRLGPRQRSILTHAACEAVARIGHPLRGMANLSCGLTGVVVGWSNTGTLWEIRTPDGALSDQVVVIDGRLGWPDLNASNARSVFRKPSASPIEASTGRSWCADGSDSPDSSACL